MRRRRESLHTITLATDDGEDDLVLELKEETDLLRRLNVRSKAPPTQSLHIFLASCAQFLKETARAHYSRLQPARCTATFLRKIRMGSIANTFSQSHLQLAARRRQVESRFNLPSTRQPHSKSFLCLFSYFDTFYKRALGCTRCGRYSPARACNGGLRAACNMGMRRLAKTNQVYAHMVIWCALGNSSSPSLPTLFFLIIFSIAKLFFGKKRNSIGIYVIGWQHAQHCRPASPLLQYVFRCLAVFFMRIFLASRPSLHLCVSTLCALKSPQYSRSPFPPIIYPIYPTYSRSTHIANFPTC